MIREDWKKLCKKKGVVLDKEDCDEIADFFLERCVPKDVLVKRIGGMIPPLLDRHVDGLLDFIQNYNGK